jgi:Arc/MetJ-type ribon-helix-helix transcriptional regulator
MVSDRFWRDADLASLTTEQRTALLLFLTAEESNIIGVYRVIWRAVGAGMGWTHDQVLNAARDLQAKDCVAIDEVTGWIWVKEWWKHNSLRGAFTGNVAKPARIELSQVPEFWKKAILLWITENDKEGACKPLLRDSQGSGGNPTTNRNLNPTTTELGGELVADIDDLVEAALWASGSQVIKPGHYRAGIRKRLETSLPTLDDLATLSAWREAQSAQRTVAAAASLPVGKWKSKQGSLIVIPETGPISITTSSGQLLSKHRSDFARDLAHGEVELLEQEAA